LKKETRKYTLYLSDILISMERIREYIINMDYNSFINDYKTIDAVIRNFEIIGEAVKNIPSNIKEKYPEIPWEEMYRLRNRIIHEYFGIDFEIIWDIATNYLPSNYNDFKRIIEKEKATNE